jgi:hypothetical protein
MLEKNGNTLSIGDAVVVAPRSDKIAANQCRGEVRAVDADAALAFVKWAGGVEEWLSFDALEKLG